MELWDSVPIPASRICVARRHVPWRVMGRGVHLCVYGSPGPAHKDETPAAPTPLISVGRVLG